MIKYRLDDLGWHQFEWLCQTLLKDTCGLSLEAWGGSSDCGRDAYCSSPLSYPDPKKKAKGPFIFQVKFVENANAAGAKPATPLLNAIRAECKSITKRAAAGDWKEPAHYVLLTNAPLSISLRKKVASSLKAVLPNCVISLQGADDICASLSAAPDLRSAFPQLLGLADLTELLASVVAKDIRERSTISIERARELAPLFVPTAAYEEALDKLARNAFVVLTGPPEMGKTCIARMIALCKFSQGWESYECLQPSDFFKVHDSKAKQVFLADDAFGSTEYKPDKARAWGDDLDRILRKVDRRHWFLWTSRPAPLNLALNGIKLEGRAEHYPTPNDVVVNASALTLEEKALILYRHAKAANLDDVSKRLVIDNVLQFVGNPHFTPERIRRFVKNRLPALVHHDVDGHAEITTAVTTEIEEPTKAMKQSFVVLPAEHQAFLVGMLDAAGDVPDTAAVHDAFARHAPETAALKAEDVADDLAEHFIRKRNYSRTLGMLMGSGAKSGYEWTHPSWRDLIIDHLSTCVAVRNTFLAKCTSEGLSLALSRAGGSKGERTFPLISRIEDWETINDAVERLLASADQRTATEVLMCLVSAFKHESLASAAYAPSQELVGKICRTALMTCRSKWQAESASLSFKVLEQYYQLSTEHAPLASSPDLQRTWEAHWLPACDELNKEPDDTAFQTDAVSLWCRLAKLLLENEPRFLRYVGHPREYSSPAGRFLERVAWYLDLEWGFTESDELQNELELLRDLRAGVFWLGQALRNMSTSCEKLLKTIGHRESDYEEQLAEMGPGWEGDFEGDYHRSHGGFDVISIFTDL